MMSSNLGNPMGMSVPHGCEPAKAGKRRAVLEQRLLSSHFLTAAWQIPETALEGTNKGRRQCLKIFVIRSQRTVLNRV